MAPNQIWSMTNFAIFLRVQELYLPTSLWLALAAACSVAIVFAIWSERRR